MSDIMLVDGDIACGTYSDVALIYDDNEIIQSAINNILTIYGENRFSKNLGNKALIKRHKMTNKDFNSIASDCKNAIYNDDRVMHVNSVSVVKSDTASACDISFVITTVGGNILDSTMSINILGGE